VGDADVGGQLGGVGLGGQFGHAADGAQALSSGVPSVLRTARPAES
jgi:hypothetical protein